MKKTWLLTVAAVVGVSAGSVFAQCCPHAPKLKESVSEVEEGQKAQESEAAEGQKEQVKEAASCEAGDGVKESAEEPSELCE